jgi:hypothetical protein
MYFVTVVNYIQIAYAVWTFVRDAKFFRIPYALLVGVLKLRFYDFKLEVREVNVLVKKGATMGFVKRWDRSLMRVQNLGITTRYIAEFSSSGVRGRRTGSPAECKLRRTLDRWRWSEYSSTEWCIACGKTELNNIGWWLDNNEFMTVKSKDYLFRRSYLCQIATDKDVITHLLNGGEIVREKILCMVDLSSDQDLNRNFFRLLQIAPPSLQARGRALGSAVLFFILVFIDLFSCDFNLLWQRLKNFMILSIKYSLGFVKLEWRKELIGILSSSSPKFLYCNTAQNKITWCENEYIVLGGNNVILDTGVKVVETFDHLFESSESEEDCEEVYRIMGRDINFKIGSGIGSGTGGRGMVMSDGEFTECWEQVGAVSNIRRYLKTLEFMGTDPVDHFSSNFLHLTNPVVWCNKRMVDFNLFILKLSEKKVRLASQHDCWSFEEFLPALKYVKDLGLDLFKLLCIHNVNFFGRPNIVSFMNTSRGQAPRIPMGMDIKVWNQYCRDVELIRATKCNNLRVSNIMTKTKRISPSSSYYRTLECDMRACDFRFLDAYITVETLTGKALMMENQRFKEMKDLSSAVKKIETDGMFVLDTGENRPKVLEIAKVLCSKVTPISKKIMAGAEFKEGIKNHFKERWAKKVRNQGSGSKGGGGIIGGSIVNVSYGFKGKKKNSSKRISIKVPSDPKIDNNYLGALKKGIEDLESRMKNNREVTKVNKASGWETTPRDGRKRQISVKNLSRHIKGEIDSIELSLNKLQRESVELENRVTKAEREEKENRLLDLSEGASGSGRTVKPGSKAGIGPGDEQFSAIESKISEILLSREKERVLSLKLKEIKIKKLELSDEGCRRLDEMSKEIKKNFSGDLLKSEAKSDIMYYIYERLSRCKPVKKICKSGDLKTRRLEERDFSLKLRNRYEALMTYSESFIDRIEEDLFKNGRKEEVTSEIAINIKEVVDFVNLSKFDKNSPLEHELKREMSNIRKKNLKKIVDNLITKVEDKPESREVKDESDRVYKALANKIRKRYDYNEGKLEFKTGDGKETGPLETELKLLIGNAKGYYKKKKIQSLIEDIGSRLMDSIKRIDGDKDSVTVQVDPNKEP